VILADTSAWVEFLRRTESETHVVMRVALRDRQVATTPAVVMEVLAGPTSEQVALTLRRALVACRMLPVEGPGDFEEAAALYRACSRGGASVRGVVDCLIAAVAIRHEIPVLASDRDFEVIARHSRLRLAA